MMNKQVQNEYKQYEYPSQILQQCSLIANAHKSNIITNRELQIFRADTQQTPLSLFKNVQLISFQSQHKNDNDNYIQDTVQLKLPQQFKLNKITSVQNDVKQLIPNFYKQSSNQDKMQIVNQTLIMKQDRRTIQQVAEDMTGKTLQQECPNKKFIHPPSLWIIIQRARQQIQDNSFQSYYKIKQQIDQLQNNQQKEKQLQKQTVIYTQLMKINNMIKQFIIDPRMWSTQILDLQYQILSTFTQLGHQPGYPQLFEEEQLLINNIVEISLKLINTYNKQESDKHIYYLTTKFMKNVNFARLFDHLLNKYDYLLALCQRIYFKDARQCQLVDLLLQDMTEEQINDENCKRQVEVEALAIQKALEGSKAKLQLEIIVQQQSQDIAKNDIGIMQQ